jgi:aminoglycoside phosphotransferase (APT) family kinase protein
MVGVEIAHEFPEDRRTYKGSYLVRQHTSVPVPEVYAWSSDPANPVGAEYIIMEKVAGVPVFKLWGEMSQSVRLGLIKQLTIFERELSSIQFPAYGSLYLRSFRRNLPEWRALDSDVDPSASYCIGRSSDRSYVLDDCMGMRE